MKQANRLPARGGHKSKGRLQKFFAAAPLIGFALFGIFPLICSVFMSFCELHTANLSEMKFVGLENFKEVLSLNQLSPLVSTMVNFLFTPIAMAIELFVAVKISKASKKLRAIFCAVIFIPNLLSSVSVALIFKMFFRGDSSGMLNSLVGMLGFEPFGWLTSSPWSYWAVLAFKGLWSGMGVSVLLILASLVSIDQSYYEAAKLDGATEAQMFRKITWPALTPVFGYKVTMALIGGFQSMADSVVMPSEGLMWWEGAGFYASDTIAKYIWNMIFVNPMASGYGPAAAAGWILAIVILIVTKVNQKAQERWVTYDF